MITEKIFCSAPRKQFQAQSVEINQAIAKVLNSESYILGTEVTGFENEFAAYVDTHYCVGVNSGTDALVLSLRALGIKSGDEVLTPSHTAVATVAAIVTCGATPVFVDVNPDSYTIDPQLAEAAITAKTRAIIAVHLYGHPCDMDALVELTERSGIYLVEDCAQAHGAKWRGRNVGTFGAVGCFSFYPTKNLGCIGDGGAIVSNDPKLAEKIRSLRQYGWDAERNSIQQSGVSRLDEIQAAILRVKLKKLDESNARRMQIAGIYKSLLEGCGVDLPTISTFSEHVFHLYVVQMDARDEAVTSMNALQIYPGIHYPIPVHMQPAYSTFDTSRSGGLKSTEILASRILSLPMYPELSESEIERIVEGVKNVQSGSN